MQIKLTEKMRKFIDNQNHFCYVASCDKQGRPNIAPKALLGIADNTLLYADLFVDRTAKNLMENDQAAIAVINPQKCSGYQFKGISNITTRGAAYEIAKKKFAELGFDEPIHAIELDIDEIFFFAQGPESKMEAA